jgi:hypothetical protein
VKNSTSHNLLNTSPTQRIGVSSTPALTLIQFVYLSGVSVMADAFRTSGGMEMDCENITDLEENGWRNCKLQGNRNCGMVMVVLRGNADIG